jgi:hypothetical protein
VSQPLPDPLIDAAVDLSDFKFMPLHVARARDSNILDATTGDEFKAAFLLWCASWHQVPCGSLPDDDTQLAKLAGYGRVVKQWTKVRAGALHGFAKCSDGRLYHPVICEVAADVWADRSDKVKRKAEDRARKKAHRSGGSHNNSSGHASTVQRTSGEIPADIEHNSAGQHGEFQRTPNERPAENALKVSKGNKGREVSKEDNNQPPSLVAAREQPPGAEQTAEAPAQSGIAPLGTAEEEADWAEFQRKAVVTLAGRRTHA